MIHNNENDPQRQFPKEFDEIEQTVSAARQRIAGLKALIEDIPDDRGPVPDFRPQGAPPINRGPGKEAVIKDLQRQIGETQKETADKVAGLTKDIDPKLAKQIRDKAAFLTDDKNLFNNMDKGNLAKQKDTEKGGDNLHGYVGAVYFESLKFKTPKEEKKREPPKEKEQGTIGSANNRMAAFLDNSNFVRATEPSNDIEAPVIENLSKDYPDKDIE